MGMERPQKIFDKVVSMENLRKTWAKKLFVSDNASPEKKKSSESPRFYIDLCYNY